MRQLKYELTRNLKYCAIADSEEFEHSYDIIDVADDYPFASVYWNPKTGKHDVCRVNTCIEYGNEIRDDKYIAKECEIFAIVALVQALHLQCKPMLSPKAYLNPSKSAVEGIA